MVKTLSTNNSNVLNDDVLRPIYFLKLEFPSGTTYLNSSDRNITFDSQSYLGAGTIGTMSDIEETSELQANGVKLTLTGIPSTYISIALTTEYQGSNATAYLGFFNDISKTISQSNRPLIIFPQGTRVLPDDRTPFKKGASRIYEELKINCLPVAINSGYVWPKKGSKNSNRTNK